MLFVARKDIDAVVAALRAAKLYDANGLLVDVSLSVRLLEVVAMQALSLIPSISTGNPDVVWAADTQVMNFKGGIAASLFTPPKLPE